MPKITEVIELDIGRKIKKILLKEIERLENLPYLEPKDAVLFEKYAKLHISLMEDMRKSIDFGLDSKIKNLK